MSTRSSRSYVAVEKVELARLRAHVAALEADKAALTTALHPFAEFRRVQAGVITAPYPQSGDWQAISTRQGDAQITIEDLELARATLAAHGTEP